MTHPTQQPPSRPGRLAVGVVGTGRVGAVLGAALHRAGHRVVAASAASTASRRRAAELLPGVPIVEPGEVVRRADLVLLAVPDDVLPGLVAGLAGGDDVRRGQFAAHPSGRYGVEVLRPLAERGLLPLALHPVLPFTGRAVDLDRLAGCAFGITAPTSLRPVAEALVVEMGGEPVWVQEQSRPLYHAALAYAANHLVTIVSSAAELLERAGAADPARLLRPLLAATLDGALSSGDASLTGPVSRGDAGTVAAHLAVLTAVAPELAPAYLTLARLTADRAIATGRLSPQAAGELLGVLADPSPGAMA